jgi:hypothetical protein
VSIERDLARLMQREAIWEIASYKFINDITVHIRSYSDHPPEGHFNWLFISAKDSLSQYTYTLNVSLEEIKHMDEEYDKYFKGDGPGWG